MSNPGRNAAVLLQKPLNKHKSIDWAKILNIICCTGSVWTSEKRLCIHCHLPRRGIKILGSKKTLILLMSWSFFLQWCTWCHDTKNQCPLRMYVTQKRMSSKYLKVDEADHADGLTLCTWGFEGVENKWEFLSLNPWPQNFLKQIKLNKSWIVKLLSDTDTNRPFTMY